VKKTIIAFSLLILFLSPAKSQVLISLIFGEKLNSPNIEFGLDGGVNYGNIANLDPGKSLAMFNLGFYFDIKLKQQLMLHTGVIVKSTQGAQGLTPYDLGNPDLNTVFSSGTVSRKVNQFAVPILLKYRFATLFHIEGGPMLSLRSKGYDTFYNSVADDDDLSYKVDIKDNYKRIDAGIMVGTGMKLSKVPKSSQIGVRYYYGLVDPLKENTGDGQNFSSFYIYMSIPIGVAKTE